MDVQDLGWVGKANSNSDRSARPGFASGNNKIQRNSIDMSTEKREFFSNTPSGSELSTEDTMQRPQQGVQKEDALARDNR